MALDPKLVERVALVAIAIDAALHQVGQDLPDWLRFELCKAVDDLMANTAKVKNQRDAGVTALLGEYTVAHSKRARPLYSDVHDPAALCTKPGCAHAYSAHYDPANEYMPGCTICAGTCLAFLEPAS